MNRKALNAGLIAVAGALVLGAGGAPASAAQDESARKHIGRPKYEDITVEKKAKASAAQAEARINRSDSEKGAMAAAARARSVEQARAVLIRNGFSPQQLEGVPINFEQVGGGDAARIKSIEIEVDCCPLKIVIIIKF